MKRYAKLKNGVLVSSLLPQAQHAIVIDMLMNGKTEDGSYSLKETDRELANVWIADAHSEGNEEYAEFLRNALANDLELYTLVDNLGTYEQELGEVVIDRRETTTTMKPKYKIEIECEEFYVAESMHEVASEVECTDILDELTASNNTLTIEGGHFKATISQMC